MQLVLYLFAFDFWFVYCNETLNFLGGLQYKPDYKKHVKLEESTVDNILVLLLFITAVID